MTSSGVETDVPLLTAGDFLDVAPGDSIACHSYVVMARMATECLAEPWRRTCPEALCVECGSTEEMNARHKEHTPCG
jgi:hypothetical protein